MLNSYCFSMVRFGPADPVGDQRYILYVSFIAAGAPRAGYFALHKKELVKDFCAVQ